MGLEVLGGDPVEIVVEALTSKEDTLRRHEAQVHVQLYRNEFEQALRDHLTRVFLEPAIRNRLEAFIPFVGGSNLIQCVADEVARPLYARGPVRRVRTDAEIEADKKNLEVLLTANETGEPVPFEPPPPSEVQEAWNALAKEMRLDATMDTVARLLTPCADMFVLVRYVEGHGLWLDVLTPDMVTVIPDPQRPTVALAIAYDSGWDSSGRVSQRVVWDDKCRLRIDSDGRKIDKVDHPYGLIPVVEIHRRVRFGCYWDPAWGKDLVAASLFSMTMDLLTIRKLKTQSHIQLAFHGKIQNVVKDQVSDEESILMVQSDSDGGSSPIYPINLESDPSALISAKESVRTMAAANHGISRERLNQKTGEVGEDIGLKERVAELAQVMICAERDVFRVAKAVSQEHPEYSIPEDTTLYVDLGQLHNRVDRETQLRIRKVEQESGERSSIDNVLEDNPEYGGDRLQALYHLATKARENGVATIWRRAQQLSKNATPENPGQDAQANGAMGPKVANGEMTKDQAAAQAERGTVAVTTHQRGLPSYQE